MILLDGKALSRQILDNLKVEIAKLPSPPHLAIILVGNNPSSLKYVELKQQRAGEIGVKVSLHHLTDNIPQIDLINLINQLNTDKSVTGFFIQLPLPISFDTSLILSSINPAKDVDGLNPKSGIYPAVVQGIITLLRQHKITYVAKHVVVVNDSQLIGQPLKSLFRQSGADVTLCNIDTINLATETIKADILISATGVKNLITSDYVKNGAVVIDIGGGDVDFNQVKDKCSFITPTFGGVGPMTVATLLHNTVRLAKP